MSTLIDVQGLSIRASEQEIIHNLDLQIEKGEWVALDGPSGSGKSTVLKYLAQLIDPSLSIQGTYLLDGQGILTYEPTQVRQIVSYCFQTPNLFGSTVKDNLAFPYALRDQDFDQDHAVTLLEEVGLGADFLSKQINTLSGGEKQRVALIRNVVFMPEVLLLDEITSALDDSSRQQIWQWIRQLQEAHDLTILMVSHDDMDRTLADRQIQLPKLTQAHSNQKGD